MSQLTQTHELTLGYLKRKGEMEWDTSEKKELKLQTELSTCLKEKSKLETLVQDMEAKLKEDNTSIVKLELEIKHSKTSYQTKLTHDEQEMLRLATAKEELEIAQLGLKEE
eukprot:15354058-Ditylum_brightwellii.AAC.1